MRILRDILIGYRRLWQENQSYQEALEDPDCELWLGVSNEEFSSLKKNQTLVLVDSVKNQKPIGCKCWNRGSKRSEVQDTLQKEGIDYQ